MRRLEKADRLAVQRHYATICQIFRTISRVSVWPISGPTRGSAALARQRFTLSKRRRKMVERCILMTTDPGDLVLDPTCGSGTTAYVAEQWGRRWITIDTSRVALALARTRLMSARYPYYLLADSPGGSTQGAGGLRQNPARRADPSGHSPGLRLRARAARDAEVDRQQRRNRCHLREMAGEAGAAARATERRARQEIRRMGNPARGRRRHGLAAAKEAHARWWEGRIARQKEIDASIAKAADVELLYDRPYEDKTQGARRRPVHGREPVAASRRPGRRRGADRPHRRRRGRAPTLAQDHAADRLRRDGAGASAHGRRPSEPRSATRSTLPPSTRGPANMSEPRAASWKARPSGAPRSSSARSSARSHASTLSPRRARRWTRASTR